MEYFDICDINGLPIGQTVSRQEAHEKGILHRTAHVWIVREADGRREVLLQKRSKIKDSFPGQYDTSSAGHIPAREEPLPSALRELSEELGIVAEPEELIHVGTFRIQYEKEFHGQLFRDNEVTQVFVYTKPVEIERLTLQASEVDEVRWFDLEEIWVEIHRSRKRICVPTAGLNVLRQYFHRLEQEEK